MNIIIFVLVFSIVLFIYIHIYYHFKTNNDLEILEINNISKERLEEICDLRQPLTMKIDNNIFKEFFIKNLISNYSSFDIKIRNIKNLDDDTELFLPLSLNDANKLMIEDKEGQYISENNSDFLIETSMAKNISENDSFFRPYMLSNIEYDYIFGSKNSYTPLRYNLNYRNYYLVLEGKVRIKMTPPKNEKYLYCNKDYDNFEFRSPLNVWNIQDEYKTDFNKMKFLEVDLEPGNIIYIPAYWWYSIQVLEENTSILSFKYRTYMNNVAILPQLILKIMQKQNIKHKIIDN
tara:strand:- start:11001 stop:11873 length:873 start_codon:yes stop_codon:yes gene_type:complete